MASPAFIPTPEQEYLLNEVPQLHGEDFFHSTYAKALYRLDLAPRAGRYQQCARCGKMRSCAQHHFTRQIFKCGLRFCENCAELLADRVTERYASAIRRLIELSKPGEKFTYLEIARRIPRDTSTIDAIAATRELVAQWVGEVKAKVAAAAGDAPYWVYAVGFQHDDQFAVRVLCISHIHLHFPEATTWQEHPPMYRLEQYFRDKLVAVWMPSTPMDRAVHEALFNGMRRLRGSRVMDLHDMEDEEDLSVDTPEDSTDKSHSKHDHKPGTCPECGGKFTRQTGWMPIEQLPTSPEGLAKLKWHDIPPKEE